MFFYKIEKKKFYRLIIFILSSNVSILASLILKQGVQGIKAFAFCILTVNDEAKLGSKQSIEVKYKDGICAKLCLKL